MEIAELVHADRSERGKLRVSGPQALWFLDQILTQRFEGLSPGDATETAMLSVHGRMTAFAESIVVAGADGPEALLHFEPELRPTFQESLQGYVFATRVELTDVTDAYRMVLFAGPGHEDAAASLGVAHPTRSIGVGATYSWAPVAATTTPPGKPISEDALEELRIASSVPRWGRDMDAKTIPQEVGIQESAVHFEKGCYLGQEAMAKIHFRGKVNRRLASLELGEGGVEPGAELTDAEGATVGRVTSVAGNRALAVVRYTIEPPTVLHVGAVEARVAA
jgi:tRNA-modifying protein YgfZ